MPPDGAMTPAMALDHVPLFIVQCLRSHHDVTAFLRALPANSLSVPLAALLELLSKSRTVRARWPEILPEFLGPKRSKLALTALPALPSIYVYDTIYWYDSSLQSTARARQWLANVMHLGKTIDSSTLDAFTSHVAQYKRLESLSVHVDTLGDLATSLPPRLRHLMLVGDDISDDDYDDFDDDDAEGEDGSAYAGSEGDVDSDLATALHRWLDNGRSHNNLTVDGLLSKVHAAAVAGVLASASSLATLNIIQSVELVKALIARTTELPHVTGLKVAWSSVDETQQLVARLDFAKLTRLEVVHTGDLNWVLPLLPSIPNLQELTLGFGRLDDIPSTLDTTATPRLRALDLQNVDFSDAAFDAFFLWTLLLPQLRDIRTVLHHWINTTGVTSVSRMYSAPEEVQVIASVLQGLPPSSALTSINVGAIKNDVDCLWMLIKSLAHHVNTTAQLVFEMSTKQYKAIKATALADHGVNFARSGNDHSSFYLHSPQR